MGSCGVSPKKERNSDPELPVLAMASFLSSPPLHQSSLPRSPPSCHHHLSLRPHLPNHARPPLTYNGGLSRLHVSTTPSPRHSHLGSAALFPNPGMVESPPLRNVGACCVFVFGMNVSELLFFFVLFFL